MASRGLSEPGSPRFQLLWYITPGCYIPFAGISTSYLLTLTSPGLGWVGKTASCGIIDGHPSTYYPRSTLLLNFRDQISKNHKIIIFPFIIPTSICRYSCTVIVLFNLCTLLFLDLFTVSLTTWNYATYKQSLYHIEIRETHHLPQCPQ